MIWFEVVTIKNGKASSFSNLGLARLDLWSGIVNSPETKM